MDDSMKRIEREIDNIIAQVEFDISCALEERSAQTKKAVNETIALIRSELAAANERAKAGWIAGRDAAAKVAQQLPYEPEGLKKCGVWTREHAFGARGASAGIEKAIRALPPPEPGSTVGADV